MRCYLGIDIGTFESKGVLVDDMGHILASAARPHKMQVPQAGWAEHDAEEDWWGDFKLISQKLIADTKINPKDIRAVGTSAIGPCMLPVDKAGDPLMNGVLYGVDTRASAEIATLTQEFGADVMLRETGNALSSQSVGPKILWLKNNRPEIYAKAYKDFMGGQNPTVHILTAPELDKFKAILVDKLRSAALDGLKEDFRKSNAETGKNYDILDIPENIKYSDPEISIDSGAKIGDKITDVTLKGKLKVTTYLFDRSVALTILKNLMSEKLLYGTERLHEILNDSLKITSIISRADTPQFSLKGTTNLSATISYDFEDSGNNLTKKLKNLIAGLSIEEATSVLHNDSNIAQVKIRLSPFWLTHVSSSPDNIEFVIVK